MMCIGYKKSFFPDNHYFFLSDPRKAKAFLELDRKKWPMIYEWITKNGLRFAESREIYLG